MSTAATPRLLRASTNFGAAVLKAQTAAPNLFHKPRACSGLEAFFRGVPCPVIERHSAAAALKKERLGVY
jgi:hypothetical protein